MTSRSRHSTTQPASYKDFNDTGNKELIPEGSGIDQSTLVDGNSSDEMQDSGESLQNTSDEGDQVQANLNNTRNSATSQHESSFQFTESEEIINS